MMCEPGHVAAKLDAYWPTLPYVGVMVIPAEDGEPEEHLELRNCPSCKSTLAKVVQP